MIDPHLIRSFLALHDEGSVTAAASSLGLQQPTVSLHLKALREALDDPLFVRQAGRMLPTPRAQSLVMACREVIDRLTNLADAAPAFEPDVSTHMFRIAMTDASQVTLLPRLLEQLSDIAPGVSISVSLLGPDLATTMAEGRIDLALGFIPWLDDGCKQRALYSQDWVCLTRDDFGPVDRGRYEDADHVTVASGTGAHILEQSLVAAGIKRKIKLALPGFLGLAAIVGARDYIATIPHHTAMTLAHLYPRLVVGQLPFATEGFRVCQYWHERFDKHAPNIWLRRICHELFAS